MGELGLDPSPTGARGSWQQPSCPVQSDNTMAPTLVYFKNALQVGVHSCDALRYCTDSTRLHMQHTIKEIRLWGRNIQSASLMSVLDILHQPGLQQHSHYDSEIGNPWPSVTLSLAE